MSCAVVVVVFFLHFYIMFCIARDNFVVCLAAFAGLFVMHYFSVRECWERSKGDKLFFCAMSYLVRF